MTLPCAIENRAQLIASGDHAIGDGDVLCDARVSESEGTLGTDRIVPWRVDRAVGDANIFATVDIHTVTIGIDGQVVDGEVIDASSENAKPPTLQNREIAESNVVAVLEGDGLVANPKFVGVWERLFAIPATAQALAPDEPLAQNRQIMKSLAPDQAVVPVIMAIILIRLPGALRFRRIIPSRGHAVMRS